MHAAESTVRLAQATGFGGDGLKDRFGANAIQAAGQGKKRAERWRTLDPNRSGDHVPLFFYNTQSEADARVTLIPC